MARWEIYLPSTKTTGTDGGSNLTLPVFAIAIPVIDAFDVPDRLSPPRPFHSGSSESGAVEFASVQPNAGQNKNKSVQNE